ncbi:putative mitochondrial protein, partial [Mucuna pruriens]
MELRWPLSWIVDVDSAIGPPLSGYAYSKVSILIVYVDDIILTKDYLTEIGILKQSLDKEFKVKDLGQLQYFLGMEVVRSKKGIVTSQWKYILDLLKETGMSDCKALDTLIEVKTKRRDVKDDNGESIHASLYEEHLESVYKILSYLKGTPGKGLFFGKHEKRGIEVYNTDWEGSITNRGSGYSFFLWVKLIPSVAVGLRTVGHTTARHGGERARSSSSCHESQVG